MKIIWTLASDLKMVNIYLNVLNYFPLLLHWKYICCFWLSFQWLCTVFQKYFKYFNLNIIETCSIKITIWYIYITFNILNHILLVYSQYFLLTILYFMWVWNLIIAILVMKYFCFCKWLLHNGMMFCRDKLCLYLQIIFKLYNFF